jgi:hypothetical protein
MENLLMMDRKIPLIADLSLNILYLCDIDY